MIVIKMREFVRAVLIGLRHWFLTKVMKMNLSRSCRVSWGAKLDKTNPRGVHIGDESYVASGACVFSHDFCRRLHTDTYIGARCFIGFNAVIMAGVKIGDEVIVGAGAVVTKDVPSHCIVAGNPAKVLRTGIKTMRFGQLVETPALQ